jgi:hypothetical protein
VTSRVVETLNNLMNRSSLRTIRSWIEGATLSPARTEGQASNVDAFLDVIPWNDNVMITIGGAWLTRQTILPGCHSFRGLWLDEIRLL